MTRKRFFIKSARGCGNLEKRLHVSSEGVRSTEVDVLDYVSEYLAASIVPSPSPFKRL